MSADTAAAEAASKDLFFEKIAELADQMIEAHGKDFTMGVLILAARAIAENKPLKGSSASSRDH